MIIKKSKEYSNILINLLLIIQIIYISYGVQFLNHSEDNIVSFLLYVLFELIIYITLVVFLPLILITAKKFGGSKKLFIFICFILGFIVFNPIFFPFFKEQFLNLFYFNISLILVLFWNLFIFFENIYQASLYNFEYSLKNIYSYLIYAMFGFMAFISIPTLYSFGFDNFSLLAISIWFMGKIFISIGNLDTKQFYLQNWVDSSKQFYIKKQN